MFLKPNSLTNRQSKNYQSGSVLVLALFIMIVMLLLGAALVRLLSSSGETIAYEVVGTRAYNAANTALQARLAELFPLNANPRHCNGTDTTTSLANTVTTDTRVFGTNTFLPNLSDVDGLKQCRIQSITCDDFKEDDVTYYRLESTGQCNLSGGERTSRTVVVEARTL